MTRLTESLPDDTWNFDGEYKPYSNITFKDLPPTRHDPDAEKTLRDYLLRKRPFKLARILDVLGLDPEETPS